MADSFRATGRLQREARIALAGPRATSRLVALLPVVAVAFGMVLGLDTIDVLVTTPPGWACLAGGILLMLAGARWSAGLVRRAGATDPFPGIVIDLMAIALAGGVSLDRARGSAAAVVVTFGVVDADRRSRSGDRGRMPCSPSPGRPAFRPPNCCAPRPPTSVSRRRPTARSVRRGWVSAS